MGDLITFPEGKRVPEGTKLAEDDLNVIGLLDSLKSAVADGGCRRVFVTLLAPDDNPVYLWCNLDMVALRFVSDAMKRKSEEMEEYLRRHTLDTQTGEDYERRRKPDRN